MNPVTVCGLAIQSEVPLPEAPSCAQSPDVIVRFGPVEKPPGDPAAERTYAVNREEFRVFWRGVGTFAIRHGREVVIEPDDNTNEAILRLYVLGPTLGILLHQRGYLVLHASVVSVAGAAVGFLGEKGWGKSTTAAALNARGYPLLADDVLGLRLGPDDLPMVQPGLPQFKLWPDAATASFGDNPDTLDRLHSGVEKRIRPAITELRTRPQPLKYLYVLDRGAALESVPMAGSAGLLALVRHSYLAQHLAAMGGVQENFAQCAQVKQKVSMRRLLRPRDLKALRELVDLIERETRPGVDVPGSPDSELSPLLQGLCQ